MVLLRPILSKYQIRAWHVTLVLAITLAVPRFILMIGGRYNQVMYIFILMWLLPFLFFSKQGRRQAGIRKSFRVVPLVVSFLAGAFFSWIVYAVGLFLYGTSDLHWYTVIGSTFDQGNALEWVRTHPSYFWVFALPAMIFSPVGEEFFYRGMVHESFTEKFGFIFALIVDASFFALTHIAHYGIQVEDGSFNFLFPSAILWVLLMMLTSVLFFLCREMSESIWGAVVSHAGFNLVMMWLIFFQL